MSKKASKQTTKKEIKSINDTIRHLQTADASVKPALHKYVENMSKGVGLTFSAKAAKSIMSRIKEGTKMLGLTPAVAKEKPI